MKLKIIEKKHLAKITGSGDNKEVELQDEGVVVGETTEINLDEKKDFGDQLLKASREVSEHNTGKKAILRHTYSEHSEPFTVIYQYLIQ